MDLADRDHHQRGGYNPDQSRYFHELSVRFFADAYPRVDPDRPVELHAIRSREAVTPVVRRVLEVVTAPSAG